MVLISFLENLGHLIPKMNVFCRFCTVKRSKSAQNFLARFARQSFYLKIRFLPILHCKTLKKCSIFSGALRAPIFFGRWFLFHQPDLQICQGGSYFICQILKLSLGGSYLGGGGVLNSNTPVLWKEFNCSIARYFLC